MKNNENTMRSGIYYITDIHLEEQLDLYTYELSEADGQIEHKIDEMLSDINNSPSSIILIGGDVANSPNLASKFYNSLSRKFSGHVVGVLGNHELWFERTKYMPGSVSVDDIVDRYREECNSVILDGDLLLISEDETEQFISYDDIIAMDNRQLWNLIHKARIVILGNTGYAAYNMAFNAFTGMYMGSVSFVYETMLGERWLVAYNKLMECADDERIYVLTHMPVSDWIDEPMNEQWRYVNGHTHENRLQRDKHGNIIAYSNNQHGYVRKPLNLKEIHS